MKAQWKILGFVLVAIFIAGTFYWYEWRPAKAAKECSQMFFAEGGELLLSEQERVVALRNLLAIKLADKGASLTEIQLACMAAHGVTNRSGR